MAYTRSLSLHAITATIQPAKPAVGFRGPAPLRSVPARPSVVARAAETSNAASTGQQQQQQPQNDGAPPPEQFSIELPTADVQRSVQLASVLQGRGAAIVVSAVQPGSAASSAGVRCGQQLLAVSDPVRRTEMWELNPQASLRYTRQAIRMRVADSIVLRLTAQPIPEWADLVAAQRAAAAAERAPLAQPASTAAARAAEEAVDDAAASGASVDVPDDLLTAIVQAAEAERSGSSFDEASSLPLASASPTTSGSSVETAASPASEGRPLTVAERLQAEYAARQAGEEGAAPQRQLTDLERRQRRRKEYFEQAGQRNDAPFFATVAAFFVVPPALILGIAWASGYLDTLDAFSLLK
ncbi:hypothetical protein ABPG77_000326 [Micractinium sp. CCAP 211/92]